MPRRRVLNTDPLVYEDCSVACPPHLGGHGRITHTDAETLDLLIRKFGIESMVDVGCGPAGQVILAQQRGLRVLGIEGDPTLQYADTLPITRFDFATETWTDKIDFDLAWCVEFLEHVRPKHLPNIFAVLRQCRYVCCTYAPPHHGGHHHVNEQSDRYWRERFDENGFDWDKHTSIAIRALSPMRFMHLRGMFFKRRNDATG